jgi:ribonuclease HIII
LDNFSELEEVSVKPPIFWKLISERPVGSVASYKSGKVVIQSGDDKWAGSILSMLSKDNHENFEPHIGVDEAGKGDFFGPLVTCALYVPSADTAGQLRQLGVRDSKSISDYTIESMHKNIVKLCSDYSIVSIGPKRLSEMLRESKNINKVLAWAHSQAIENVIEKSDDEIKKVVIDQFSKKKSRILDAIGENGSKLDIVQKHGGESDVAVAAASIVARANFVEEIRNLSDKYGMRFPKGASNVIDFAKLFVKQHGREELDNVAKTTFKITQRIL